jgi:hypothetical protein
MVVSLSVFLSLSLSLSGWSRRTSDKTGFLSNRRRKKEENIDLFLMNMKFCFSLKMREKKLYA